MVNKPQLSGRIARWVLPLQEFDFDVDIRPGKKHANARFKLTRARQPLKFK